MPPFLILLLVGIGYQLLTGSRYIDDLRVPIVGQYSLLSFIVMAVLVVMLSYLLKAFLQYQGTQYVLTNKRIIAKRGIVRLHTQESLLSKLQAVNVSQSFMGRLFDYGSVVVIGIAGNRDIYEYVSQPLEFQRLLQSQIMALKSVPQQ